MLETAESQGFQPRLVLFDSWYTSLNNLKAVQAKGWLWLSQLRSNRRVNREGQGDMKPEMVDIPEADRQEHLRGYGYIRVFGQSPQTGKWNTGPPMT